MRRIAAVVNVRFLYDIQAIQAVLLDEIVAVVLRLFQTTERVAAFDSATCPFVGADVDDELGGDGRHESSVPQVPDGFRNPIGLPDRVLEGTPAAWNLRTERHCVPVILQAVASAGLAAGPSALAERTESVLRVAVGRLAAKFGMRLNGHITARVEHAMGKERYGRYSRRRRRGWQEGRLRSGNRSWACREVVRGVLSGVRNRDRNRMATVKFGNGFPCLGACHPPPATSGRGNEIPNGLPRQNSERDCPGKFHKGTPSDCSLRRSTVNPSSPGTARSPLVLAERNRVSVGAVNLKLGVTSG